MMPANNIPENLTSVDCGSPGNPQNGSLESYTNTTEGSEVFYRCDPGLVPEGRMRAVCTENGWSLLTYAALLVCTNKYLHDLVLLSDVGFFFLLQVLSCAHVPPAMLLQDLLFL